MSWREIRGGLADGSLGPWLLFAFFIQLTFAMPTGTNPSSRWAALCAGVEEGTFRIDSYRDHTIDWAQGPDGHFYSNKAPGPLLLGLPLFYLLDRWQTSGMVARQEREAVRRKFQGINLRILSFVFQILPFFFLVLWWAGTLKKIGTSAEAQIIASIALLAANTATVFLNSYFGHGLTAVFSLAMAAAIFSGAPFWVAFFFGWTVLCEYSGAIFLIPLVILWFRPFWRSRKKIPQIVCFISGASIPGLLWIVYHTVCFGGPFRIANQFQNPIFVDNAYSLWGIIGLPDPKVLWELTLGPSRGLLWTQPWVLILGAVILILPRVRVAFTDSRRRFIEWTAWSFVLLFFLNASFGGWHGGDTPGPRYLSAGLVLLAPTLGMVWDALTPGWRRHLWSMVALSVFFQLVFLSVYQLPPSGTPLWEFYWDQFMGEHWKTPLVRLGVAFPLAAWLLHRSRGRQADQSKPPFLNASSH